VSSVERTYLMVKPDGVQRGLCGEIVNRFEKKGLKLVAMKLMVIPKDVAENHYGEHKGKKFYDSLISYITSGPVLAMVWEGDNAVAVCRNMMGKTNPQESAPGTIRGDYGMQTGMNLIHGSDSPESAEREIKIFFKPEELVSYTRTADKWIYE
jgi:nucleoside-diphosphate kinase